MLGRIRPWVFGIAAAGVLFALHIHRNSWQYVAILVGVTLVALVIRRYRVSITAKNLSGGEPPARDAEQVFHQAPGSDAGSAEGDR